MSPIKISSAVSALVRFVSRTTVLLTIALLGVVTFFAWGLTLPASQRGVLIIPLAVAVFGALVATSGARRRKSSDSKVN